MFIGTLVKPKFGMLQNYFCRNSKLLVDVDNIFSHVFRNNQGSDNYESFPLFLDLSQEIHLIASEKEFL